MHSERERPWSFNKTKSRAISASEAAPGSRADTLTETRLLVRAHVAVRRAASAGAVGGGESAQRAVEPARAALQVVAVGTGEALGLVAVAVARQAGAVAGVTRALSRLEETAEREARSFKSRSDKERSVEVTGPPPPKK